MAPMPADHPAADRKPQPRQQEGDRARQDDGSKQPPVAGAQARCDLDQARIGGANRGVSVDCERQHRQEEDDQNALAEPGADPDHDQRQERHLRRGIERREERFDRVGEATIPPAGEPERNADRDRQTKAEDVAGAAPSEVGPDLPGHEEHAKRGRRDERGRGDEDRLELQSLRRSPQQRAQHVGPPAALEALPAD